MNDGIRIRKLVQKYRTSEGSRSTLSGTEIADVDKLLESHFLALQNNPDNKANVPIWHRLKAFKLLIESNL